ncbi:hypothetical protein KL949_001840 [Ogataea haglerorum]|nr:hypothetical protein KL950_001251 [Ogataea haglerorum]KAG7720582.1 hypothetical protein KL913_001482 [Ogataea haglerorum]KAG7720968.1 hypothetical protein KL949_001840 [Ogataea haglerorum]KAG7743905.1 hypothetical protein KL932_001228 [Ogataea haglerorum]KAG7791437.1 hypothetical protein KL910_001563 [Ogataea haglerorum]
MDRTGGEDEKRPNLELRPRRALDSLRRRTNGESGAPCSAGDRRAAPQTRKTGYFLLANQKWAIFRPSRPTNKPTRPENGPPAKKRMYLSNEKKKATGKPISSTRIYPALVVAHRRVDGGAMARSPRHPGRRLHLAGMWSVLAAPTRFCVADVFCVGTPSVIYVRAISKHN